MLHVCLHSMSACTCAISYCTLLAPSSRHSHLPVQVTCSHLQSCQEYLTVICCISNTHMDQQKNLRSSFCRTIKHIPSPCTTYVLHLQTLKLYESNVLHVPVIACELTGRLSDMDSQYLTCFHNMNGINLLHNQLV